MVSFRSVLIAAGAKGATGRAKVATTTAVVLLMSTAVSIPMAAAAEPAPPSTWANLFNPVTGKCADLPNYGPGQADGPVTQFGCDYSDRDNQRWRLEPHGTRNGAPVYTVKNRADGYCMDLPDYGAVLPGTPVSEYACAADVDEDNQLFYAAPSTVRGTFKLVHVKSDNLCLDVAGFGTGGDDARLTLWHCSDVDDHQWALRTSSETTAGATDGTVATAGASLRVRAAPDARADERGRSLPNGTPVSVICQVPGIEDAAELWLRLPNDGYVNAKYVDRVGDAPTCGGGPAEDLRAVLDSTQTFRDLDAAWATLGFGRQAQQEWRVRYAQALKRVASHEALRKAGIDESEWRPDNGLTPGPDGTDPIVQKVYGYYGQLFQDHPELEWAGLAKLAGGPVYAGIQDMAYLTPPVNLNAENVSRQLLRMQKAIFEDLAWQHELYVQRGIDGLRRANEWLPGGLGDAGARNAHLVDGGATSLISGWEDIASGDPVRIDRGNKVLVAQEQDPILQRFYDELLAEAPTWMSMTTGHAQSPVPDNETFWRACHRRKVVNAFPHGYYVDVPQCHHPRPNVGHWEDRQIWVYRYMFPRYQRWLAEDPDRIHREVRESVSERAADYRRASRHKLTFGVF